MKNIDTFTPRELQVLKHIALGHQRKFIADALEISIKTVDAHISNLHKKSNTHLWGELVVFAKNYKTK